MAEMEHEQDGSSNKVDASNRFRRDLSSPVGKKFDPVKDDERVFKTKGDRPMPRSNRGPAMGKVSADEYRNFMRAQGIKFRKV